MRQLGIVLFATGSLMGLVGNAWAEGCSVDLNGVCVMGSEPEPQAGSGSPDGNPPSQGESPQHLAEQLLARLNAERIHSDQLALPINTWANSVADSHSQAMAAAGALWHNMDYFKLGRKAMGANFLGENVVMASSIDQAHHALMNSASHRANILDSRFNYVGIAVARDETGYLYATQAFARVPPVAALPARRASVSAVVPVEAPQTSAAEAPVRSGTTNSRLAALRPTALSQTNRTTLASINGLLLMLLAARVWNIVGPAASNGAPRVD